jgi:hypothetical protein
LARTPSDRLLRPLQLRNSERDLTDMPTVILRNRRTMRVGFTLASCLVLGLLGVIYAYGLRAAGW